MHRRFIAKAGNITVACTIAARSNQRFKRPINILNDGKEGYYSASETTDNVELKSLFLNFGVQRGLYADELKAHLELHGGSSENESGGVLGALHRTWIDIKEAFSSTEDAAILNAIETGEKTAIEKFQAAINNPQTNGDHIDLLQSQLNSITDALSQIQEYKIRLNIT